MAPSARHLHQLVAKNTKLLKATWKKASRLVQSRFPASARPAAADLHPTLAHNSPRHPIHPVAYLRQRKGRWYTTHSAINAAVRRFTTAACGEAAPKFDYRSAFTKTRVGAAVSQLTGRTPFASTLRPNLTGGTLGRTAGGYALGSGRAGGARYFSHTPAAPAQVIHNVSQAVRAFCISGKKAQFDGVDPQTGEKRYRAVSALQKDVYRKLSALPKATPGSHIDFAVNPTITALSPLSAVAGFELSAEEKKTLNSDGLLDALSVDFARALKDLAAILNDLKRLSALGDLPITYQPSVLRVHFPGCDADSVENLCQELGVRRGIVRQDEDFDAFVGTEIALLFPFAPSKTASELAFFEGPIDNRRFSQDVIDWRNMMSPERGYSNAGVISTASDHGFEEIELENPWLLSPSGYESFHTSDISSAPPLFDRHDQHSPLEYQGFEGIYRFMEQCEGPHA